MGQLGLTCLGPSAILRRLRSRAPPNSTRGDHPREIVVEAAEAVLSPPGRSRFRDEVGLGRLPPPSRKVRANPSAGHGRSCTGQSSRPSGSRPCYCSPSSPPRGFRGPRPAPSALDRNDARAASEVLEAALPTAASDRPHCCNSSPHSRVGRTPGRGRREAPRRGAVPGQPRDPEPGRNPRTGHLPMRRSSGLRRGDEAGRVPESPAPAVTIPRRSRPPPSLPPRNRP